MDALEFRVGAAKLVSYSPERGSAWRVVFEDEGAAGYCYACDGERATVDDDFDVTVLDAMLVYNVDAMKAGDADADRERLATVEWSADGERAVLRLDGVPQVLIDFHKRESFCRSNFPNFMDNGSGWRTADHRWDDDAMLQFETAALGVTG